jgi:hypothetical protein
MKLHEVGILIGVGIVVAISTRLIMERLFPYEGVRATCGDVSMVLKDHGFAFNDKCVASSLADPRKQLWVTQVSETGRQGVMEDLKTQKGWNLLPSKDSYVIAIRKAGESPEFLLWSDGRQFSGRLSVEALANVMSKDPARKNDLFLDAKVYDVLCTLQFVRR